MKLGYTRKVNLTVGLAFLMGPAIFASFFLISGIFTHLWLLGTLIVAAQILFIYGCCLYAIGKGQHPALGLLGLLYIPGLLILAFFPDKHKGEDTSSGCLSTFFVFLIFLLLIFGPVIFYVTKAIKNRSGGGTISHQQDQLNQNMLKLSVTILESSFSDLGSRMKAMDSLMKEGSEGQAKLVEVDQYLKNKSNRSYDDEALIKRIDESLNNTQSSTSTPTSQMGNQGTIQSQVIPGAGLGASEPAFKTIKIVYQTRSELQHIVIVGEEIEYIDIPNKKSRTEKRTWREKDQKPSAANEVEIFYGSRKYVIYSSHPNLAGYSDFPVGDLPPVFEINTDRIRPPIGEETIAEHHCHVYAVDLPNDTGKKWVWSRLVLKEVNEVHVAQRPDLDHHSEKEAVDIQENIPLGDDLFSLPSNIELVPLREYGKRIRELRKR